MFARKYANPSGYWRDYAAWWARWKDEYPDIASPEAEAAAAATAAFYSGK